MLVSLSDEDKPVEPPLAVWEQMPWRAWTELSSERVYMTVGYAVPMGATVIQPKPGPIPWSKINEWCDRRKSDDDEREFVFQLVVHLDQEFLAHWNAKHSEQMAGPAPGKQSKHEKLARWGTAANDG